MGLVSLKSHQNLPRHQSTRRPIIMPRNGPPVDNGFPSAFVFFGRTGFDMCTCLRVQSRAARSNSREIKVNGSI